MSFVYEIPGIALRTLLVVVIASLIFLGLSEYHTWKNTSSEEFKNYKDKIGTDLYVKLPTGERVLYVDYVPEIHEWVKKMYMIVAAASLLGLAWLWSSSETLKRFSRWLSYVFFLVGAAGFVMLNELAKYVPGLPAFPAPIGNVFEIPEEVLQFYFETLKKYYLSFSTASLILAVLLLVVSFILKEAREEYARALGDWGWDTGNFGVVKENAREERPEEFS